MKHGTPSQANRGPKIRAGQKPRLAPGQALARELRDMDIKELRWEIGFSAADEIAQGAGATLTLTEHSA